MPPLKNIAKEEFAQRYTDFKSPTKGNATATYMAMRPDVKRDSARRMAYERFKSDPEVKRRIVEILEEKGYTDDLLAGDIMSFRDAVRTVFVNGEAKHIPDNHLKMVVTKLVLELKGYLSERPVLNQQINIDDSILEKVHAMVKK